MSAGQRLPEDVAAEQAYLAELRAQQESAEKQRAAARRAELEAQGLLGDPLSPAPFPREVSSGSGASSGTGIAPEKLASLSPEALAALPAEVREMIEQAQARQPSDVVSGQPPLAAIAPPNSASAQANPASQPDAEPGSPPQPAVAEPKSEEELAQLELAILGKVQAELGHKDSVLVRDRAPSMIQRVGGALDGVLAVIFRRDKTW